MRKASEDEQQEASPALRFGSRTAPDQFRVISVALKRFASGSRRLRTRACVRRGPDTGQTAGHARAASCIKAQ